MVFQTMLSDPTFQGLSLNLGASLCYDFLKESVKSIFRIEKSDFDDAVNETIKYFSDNAAKSIEILPGYFKGLFDDQDAAREIAEFESGSRDVSIRKLADSFVKAGFYYEGPQTEKAEGIVRYFLKALTQKILSDSNRAPALLFNVLQQMGKQDSEYSQVTIQLIQQMQVSLESKMDVALQGIEYLKKAIGAMNANIGAFPKSVEARTGPENTQLPPKLELAIKLHNEGKLRLARQLYIEVLDSRPTDINVLWKTNSNLARTYLNPEEEKIGVAYFKQACNYFPNEEKGKIQLAFAQLIEGEYDPGLATVKEILSQNPTCVDAVVIGANIFIRRGGSHDQDNAKELFTDEILKNYLSFYTFAWVLKDLGQLKEAEKYYRKLLEHERRPEVLNELALTIFEPVLKKVGGHNPVYRVVEESEEVVLNEVLALLNEAIGKFKTNDDLHGLAYAYLNRGVVHSFLNHLDDSYDDCVQSENAGLDVALLFRNKGVALVMLDRAGEAVGEFKKAVDRGDETSILYYLRALIQSNQLGQAREILLDKISYPEMLMTAENLEFYLIYSEILERELNTEDADKIVEFAKAKFSYDGEVFIRLSNSMRTRHGTQKAIEVVLQALPSVTRKRDILELMLPDLYFVSNMWQEALEAYAKFVRSDYYDLPIARTLICLFNLGKHASCLERLRLLKSKHSADKLIRDLEARINFEAEEFAMASVLYKDLAVSFKDPDYYVRWGHCEFRLAHHEEAKRILNSATKEFYEKADDLLRISGAFAVIGETRKALELAFRAVTIDPQSADAALNYFFIFNQHSALHRQEGDVAEEEIQLARDIGEHFEERFPGIPGLKKFRLPKLDEQMTPEDFTKIFKQEMPSQVDSRKCEQIYLSYRYPLSTFSILVGKDIVDTWERVTANSSYNLWAYNPQNFPQEEANIGSKLILAEPISILTLQRLKCLNLLEKLFEKVVVPQRFLDTVQSRIANERLSEFEGSTEIFVDGEKLGLIKTSPEIIAKRIEDSKELRHFLTDRVVGFPIVDDFWFREEMKPYLRPETIQAAERAVAMNVPLLSDEVNLATVPNMPRLRTISTYLILNHSLRKGLLGINEFNKAILDLASASYHFVPINAQILIQGLRESDFKVTRRSTAGFQSIAHTDSDPILEAIVIAEFLGLLFNVGVTELTKGYWFDYAMDYIPKIRFDLATLLKKMEAYLEEVVFGSASNDVGVKWVKTRIRYWLKRRGISLQK